MGGGAAANGIERKLVQGVLFLVGRARQKQIPNPPLFVCLSTCN